MSSGDKGERSRKPRTSADPPEKERPPVGAPGHERRSKHRVADDQYSGEGADTALSRLQMIERWRAQVRPDKPKDK